MAALSTLNLSSPLFVQKNEETGTEISLSPTDVSFTDAPSIGASFAVFEIKNENFQRRYVICTNHLGPEKAEVIAKQILQLDLQTMEKLPKESVPLWTLSEEPILAALQSENPEMRAQGARWLLEKHKNACDTLLQKEEAVICSYFDELEKWENEPFEYADEQMRNWERGFFAITDREFSSLEEEAQAIASLLNVEEENQQLSTLLQKQPSSEEEKQKIKEESDQLIAHVQRKVPFHTDHAILRALWFPNHPHHAKCRALLETRRTSDFPSRYLPLFIGLLSVPSCILDRLELPGHTRTFPKDETREQVLAFWRQKHERAIQSLEGRLEDMETPPLPPLEYGQTEFAKSNETTGTALSIHYTQKRGDIFGDALITNGPLRHSKRIYLQDADEQRIRQIADRILQLDRSAVRVWDQPGSLEQTLIFAGLLSESAEVRAKAAQWLAEDRAAEQAK